MCYRLWKGWSECLSSRKLEHPVSVECEKIYRPQGPLLILLTQNLASMTFTIVDMMYDATDQTEDKEEDHLCQSRPVDSIMVTGKCGYMAVLAGLLVYFSNRHEGILSLAVGIDGCYGVISLTIMAFLFILTIP
jgi:hypothetical protein